MIEHGWAYHLWMNAPSSVRPAEGRSYGGLGRYYSGRRRRELGLTAPFGWTVRRVEYLDMVDVLPCWLAWALDAWDNRYHWTFGLAHRLGLWAYTGKGHDISVGRPTVPRWLRRAWWCFLHDRDEYPRLDVCFASRKTFERFAERMLRRERRLLYNIVNLTEA